MAVRECTVSFTDFRGVRHSVNVQASSVLEAAGLGLKHIREQDMLDTEDGSSDITVEIVTKTTHTVPLMKLRDWRDSNSGRTPQEIARKARTR
jgi:hypothetical protein